MKLGLRGALALFAILLAAGGCGRRRAPKHERLEATAAPEPTPDNTPIPVLQTPAGMVLKLEEPTANPASTPVVTPPASNPAVTAPAANPTP